MVGISYRKAMEKGLLTDKDKVRILAVALAKADQLKISPAEAQVIGPEHDTQPNSLGVLWPKLLAKLRNEGCTLDLEPSRNGTPSLPGTPASTGVVRATGRIKAPKTPSKTKNTDTQTGPGRKHGSTTVKKEPSTDDNEHADSDHSEFDPIPNSKKRSAIKDINDSPIKKAKSMSLSPIPNQNGLDKGNETLLNQETEPESFLDNLIEDSQSEVGAYFTSLNQV